MMTDNPTTSTGSGATKRRRLLQIGLAGIVVALLAAGGFIWWFLKDDAPEAVSLDTAAQVLRNDDSEAAAEPSDAESSEDESTESATETATETESGGSESTETELTEAELTDAGASEAGDSAADAGIEGSWSVDTTIGEFSFEDSTGSFVGFRVEEELSTIGSTTAVGRTPVVSGTIVIEGDTLIEATIEADMTSVTTNDARRDDRVAGALESDQFPLGTFELLAPISLGEGAAAGEPVAVDAVGNLTVHGVTNEVTFALQAQLIDGVVVVVGSTDIEFADYGVSVPTAPIVLSADDFGVVEFQLLFSR